MWCSHSIRIFLCLLMSICVDLCSARPPPQALLLSWEWNFLPNYPLFACIAFTVKYWWTSLFLVIVSMKYLTVIQRLSVNSLPIFIFFLWNGDCCELSLIQCMTILTTKSISIVTIITFKHQATPTTNLKAYGAALLISSINFSRGSRYSITKGGCGTH